MDLAVVVLRFTEELAELLILSLQLVQTSLLLFDHLLFALQPMLHGESERLLAQLQHASVDRDPAPLLLQ